MAGGYDFEEHRVRHLELIQAVIGRLGNDSFLMKGWALTVAVAFNGFAINEANWQLAGAGLLPTAIFWGLDAYFLRCERLFRALYANVRARNETIKPFFMGATSKRFASQVSRGEGDNVVSWWKTVWSRTLLAFYGAIVLAGLFLVVLLVG